MEHRWNETDRGKPKCSEKYLFQCHFVHHKSHRTEPGSSPGLRGGRPATNRLSHGTANTALTDMVVRQCVCYALRTESLNIVQFNLGFLWSSEAMPYVRGQVADLSTGLKTRPVYVGFVVDKVALGQVYLPAVRSFPCQYHSTRTL